jgi:glycosyltransferase involved in cell wall biosynthesis
VPGKNLKNIYNFYLKALPIIIRGNFDSVFFHMTDLQCALLSPLITLRGKRQYLWYAHTFKSKFLIFSSYFVDGIVTSTPGSCPISGPKLVAIGQAINENQFRPLAGANLDISQLIHVGRFDKSKKIELLIDAAAEIRKLFSDLRLTLVGSPANLESQHWAENLVSRSKYAVEEGWLIFKGSIPRASFPEEVQKNGCFFHAYTGSLDKTLIEATMIRVPVVTINPEYREIFGTWGDSNQVDLVSEYLALRKLTKLEIEIELARRLDIARKNHSLAHWITELTLLLR